MVINTTPLVSVIVPTYNSGKYIKETLESVFSQTYSNIEVIVVDDGSADDTKEVLEPYMRQIKYIHKGNGGPASARNRGIREASGEFIAFLDADDLWLPGKLRTQVNFFNQNNGQTGLVHTNVIKMYGDGFTKIKLKGDYCAKGPYSLFMGNFITNSSVLVRRQCFEALGYFDESKDLIANEDYDMWLRISSKYEIGYIDEPLVIYRFHSQGISRDPDRAYPGEKKVVEKALRNFGKDYPDVIRSYKRRRSGLFFSFGYEYFAINDFRQARKKFITSIICRPWNLRAVKYYFLTFLGQKNVALIRRIKKSVSFLNRRAPNGKKRPIRIMHIVFSLGMGGLENLVLNLLKSLDTSRYTPFICSLTDGGQLTKEFSKCGIKVFSMGKKSGVDYALHFRLAKLLRQQKIDLVHTHNNAPFYYGTIAAKIARIPVIIHTEHRESDRRGKKIVLMSKLLSRGINTIVADCQNVVDFLCNVRGISNAKIRIIFNGIDINKYTNSLDVLKKKQELGIDKDSLIIGNVARLVPMKDHMNLLEAFHSINKSLPNTKLVIVGDGKLRKDLEKRAEELNLDGSVIFLGIRTDIPEILNVFDVFVLSSESEGLSLSLLEAMAASKPVVATNVGGNSEVIDDGATGLLVPPKNSKGLADALIKILSNKELSNSIGIAGQRKVKERFSLEFMTKEYEELYEHWLEKRGLL